MKISNVRHESHRNGIAGVGFDVATFDMKEDGVKHQMLGVLFPNEGECAVFDLDLLAQGVIAFGVNSYRGDHFEDELRRFIETTPSEVDKKVKEFEARTESDHAS